MKPFEHGGRVWDGDPRRWLDFSANLNPAGCPPAIGDALRRAVDEAGWYPDAAMEAERSSLAAYLRIPAEHALPTAGGMAALELVIRAVDPRRVVIPVPAFVEYRRMAQSLGKTVVPLPMIGRRHAVSFPLPLLGETVRGGDLVILCNPVNPLGCAISREAVLETAALAGRRSAAVLVDEAFIDYCPENSVRTAVASRPHLWIAGSLTKIFAIPGVRLGYVCAAPDQIETLRRIQPPWCLSAFSAAAARALNRAGSFVTDSLRSVHRERPRLKTMLEALGAYAYPSAANFLLTDWRPMNLTSAKLGDGLRRRGILVRDCANYESLDEYHVRTAVKDPGDNDRLIAAIEAVLRGEPP